MHRIVVVGGGAGGLELVTRLGDLWGARRNKPRAMVTLVDINPTHLWKPLLHEVASGSIDTAVEQLAYAAQAKWHGFSFQQGALESLDRAQQCITLNQNINHSNEPLTKKITLSYDTLILAVGSVTNFFNIPGAEQHSFSLDTQHQAEYFRQRFTKDYLTAQKKDMTKPFCVTIVGAGATGVELAAELRHTAKTLNSYNTHSNTIQPDLCITLVELAPRILPALPEGLSNAAMRLINKMGITIKVGAAVAEIKEHSVHLKSEEVIASDLTVWAAGIKAPPVLSTLDQLAVNRQNQLLVTPTLASVSDANIFALGDCASCPWIGKPEGTTVPPRAQAAHQQASFLVKLIKQRLNHKEINKIFKYHDFGSLISLGHITAVGNLRDGFSKNGLIIRGWIARWIYASLYRMHIAALHGWPRMVLDTVGRWLSRFTRPRIKLH